MNLRVAPKDPEDYVRMSHVAQACWLSGRDPKTSKVIVPGLVLCDRLEWATDDARAIIIFNVTNEAVLRGRLSEFVLTDES